MAENAGTAARLRDTLIQGVLERIPGARLNGDRIRRLPGNANFCFDGIEGESLLLRLDMAGICASSGSACTSGSLSASHVLLALGLDKQTALGSLRLTLDAENTMNEVKYVLETLPGIVSSLREMRTGW